MNFLDNRVPESIWNSLTPCANTGCWLWTRPHRLKFKVTIDGKQRPAHVVLYETMAGTPLKLDAGRKLGRVCGVDVCCNPLHLTITTRARPVIRHLVGQRFGHLIVLERGDGVRRGDGVKRHMWMCRCDCGVVKSVREWNLLDGEARSCGCKRYDLLLNDLTGRRFGKMTVIARAPNNPKHGGAYWRVRCDCGVEKVAKGSNVQRGLSCGCTRKHGAAQRAPAALGCNIEQYRRSYRIWGGMKSRCLNPNATRFDQYGGRGIGVCQRWMVFRNFVEDMGVAPDGMSLERIDTNGNYEPSNCRWATQKEQMQNTRTSRARVARVLESLSGKDPALIAELRKQLLGAA